jgi:hypothetical protein
MRRSILFILAIFYSINLKSQTIGDISNDYKIGINYLQQNNFIMADSFLAKSFKQGNPFNLFVNSIDGSIPINDLCYNYAIAKLGLKDTCSFCSEIYIASTYNDNDAFSYYRKICVNSIDSAFYDKNYKSCNKEKSKYIIIKYFDKFRKKTYGRVLDLKKKESNESKINFIGFGNIIGLFRIEGTDTVYTRVNYLPKFKNWSKDFYSYIDSKLNYPEAKNIARAKCKCYDLTVEYKVLIDEKGKVQKVDFFDERPENLDKIYLDEALRVVNKASGYITPGNILGKDVKIEIILPVHFNLRE